MSCKVVAREGENLEELLRRFRRSVNDANILGECKKREYFLSKADARRRKSKEAAAKRRKVARLLAKKPNTQNI